MDNAKVNINEYLTSYLMKNKIMFIIFCLLLTLYPLRQVVLPSYYGKVIAGLNKGESASFVQNVKRLVLIFIVVQVLSAIIHKVQGMMVPKFLDYSVQRIFSNLLQNKKLNYENLEVGEILAKVIKVPHIIYKYLDLLRHVVFSQLFILIAAIIYYKGVSNKILYVFLFLVFGIIVLQYITFKATLSIEMKQEKHKDNVYQHFQDLLNNLISVVICKREDYEKNYIHEKMNPFIEAFYKSLHLNFIFRLIFSVFNIFSFILLNYMLYDEYKNKNMTKEMFLSSFIMTYSVLQLFLDANHSTRHIVEMLSQVRDMEEYFNNMSVTDAKQDQNIVENKAFSRGNIQFRNVSYQYEGNETFKGKYKYALKNIDIDIKENENVAIVGQIGSGKSTLVKLLLKLFEPSQGDILIHNVDLKHITRDELYDHVFYIPQKPKLLNRSLYENLYYGFDVKEEDKEKNVEKIIQIMKKMNIEQNIIDIFTEKMDQNLGNDGIKLSGGQRQMVWIIRAMLRNPSIIIFDEPTSALDKKNKNKIMNVIKEIGRDKTILIISHDEIQDTTFRKIYMKQGEVEQKENQMFGWM